MSDLWPQGQRSCSHVFPGPRPTKSPKSQDHALLLVEGTVASSFSHIGVLVLGFRARQSYRLEHPGWVSNVVVPVSRT